MVAGEGERAGELGEEEEEEVESKKRKKRRMDGLGFT